MKWCSRLGAEVLGLAAGFALAGCDYSSRNLPAMPEGTFSSPRLPVAEPRGGGTKVAASVKAAGISGEERTAERLAILDNVMKLIANAASNPEGNNFGNATKNLNQFFAGTAKSAYGLSPEAREMLLAKLPKEKVDELEAPEWIRPDARHLEDCMLYHAVAVRVAGVGDDLTRVRRVFDWMVEQVQLVPAGSLGSPGLGQAFARPYDVLVRGMATEAEGIWAERGWLFLSLCRQLGLDAGVVTYTPPGGKEPVVWCVAVLIDKKPYLFDTRIGLPIADAKGDGVSTLAEAMTDPLILDRMELPGQSPYGTSRAALVGSASKIGILLDSSPRYFSPRMRLLQQDLVGKNLTILYRDPAEQRDRWAEALGDQFGKVALWDLPILVETLLFTNPDFVKSTKQSLFLFEPSFPLRYARMRELRGETWEAVQDYVAMRFAEKSLLMDKKTPMPKEIQEALDVYATYFLGMCHLEQKDARQAQFFFEKTLKMLPEPGGGRPFFNMYRWGAQTNLARLEAAKGKYAKAAAYYSQNDPTTQRHGNMLKARELVWRDPMAPAPVLPKAPPQPGEVLLPAAVAR